MFADEKYLTYDVDERLNEILLIYQKYFRDVFYLETNAEHAAETMRMRFVDAFRISDDNTELGEIEQRYVAKEFEKKSLHFLGGRTGGYFGPYVWQNTEVKEYDVVLPNGTQKYTVKLLDGFVCNSWCDYISFGAVGTGGWTGADGIVNCIKSCYNFEEESFTVSLLKHEAQHARDLANCKNMSSVDLEYRAKLVELIYSEKRNLLRRFAREADVSNGNAHAIAANRIVENFAKKTCKDICALSIAEVQTFAQALFEESNKVFEKYTTAD